MGVVYRAHDLKLGRDLTLKVLPADTLHDETARARLMREARLAATQVAAVLRQERRITPDN